jgi:thiamine biosynthesis lipoprotein
MMLSRRRFLVLAAATTALGSVSRRGVFEWRGDALGGEARIRLEGPRDQVEAALAESAAEIDRLENLFSLHRPDSQLSRLNRDGGLDAPARDLVNALTRAAMWKTRTEGAFDPAVQPDWLAAARGEPPKPFPNVAPHLAPGRITLPPRAALTLNGIAQGLVADRVADLLIRRGFGSPVIDTGETRLPGPARRLVGLSHAEPVRLADCAVSTSEPGALRFASGRHHILDPRTGATPEIWRAVTVIAPRAIDADALSTAFAVSTAERIGDLVPADTLVIATDPEGRTRRFGLAPRGVLA